MKQRHPRQASPKPVYGLSAAGAGLATSSAARRARSAEDSPSKAAARASTVPAFAVSPSLVQPLVQPETGLDVSALCGKGLECVGA